MQCYDKIQPLPSMGCAVAVGYFDGVHIGHQAVIQAAASYARSHGLDAAVFTFELPARSGIKGSRLFTGQDKLARVEAMGVQFYLTPGFEEFKDLTPEQYVTEMLAGAYKAKAVFCGDNYTFGKKAAGDVALLRKLCEPLGIRVCVVPMATYHGDAVSSTRIRFALQEGRIEEANAMLGTPYCIDFDVVHGKGLGRTLGMPTINQHYPDGFQLPRFGFYITRIWLDGAWHPAATGVGSRPTVNSDESQITCETFVPGYSGNVYGQTPRLEFHHFLRESEKFDSLEALKQSVFQAGEQAVEYFGGRLEIPE